VAGGSLEVPGAFSSTWTRTALVSPPFKGFPDLRVIEEYSLTVMERNPAFAANSAKFSPVGAKKLVQTNVTFGENKRYISILVTGGQSRKVAYTDFGDSRSWRGLFGAR
jgi:hypothetical protein